MLAVIRTTVLIAAFAGSLAISSPAIVCADPRQSQAEDPMGTEPVEGLVQTAQGAAASGGSGIIIGGPDPGATVPFSLNGRWIVVEASIDDGAPRPFMFDTGGLNAVTPDVAKELGSPVVADTNVAGVGSSLVAASIIEGQKITIGTAVLSDQKIRVFDLPNAFLDRGARPRLAGMIGSEVLSKYAVRINYQKRLLTLMSGNQFTPPANSIVVPLRIRLTKEDGLISATLPAEIENIPAEFTLDTGSAGQISLSGKFENEHRLLDRYPKFIELLTVGGIGGYVKSDIALGNHLKFAGIDLSDPVVSRPADFRAGGEWPVRWHDLGEGVRREVLKTGMADGLLGAGVLSHFVVTINYQTQRAYFEPLGQFKLATALFGLGLSVDKPTHDSFKVIDILPKSPAEGAGIGVGDRIVAVDGKPATDLSLSDFIDLTVDPRLKRAILERADGKRFELPIVQYLP
ncbi:MAG TPA: aspartyl protease family protein [Stellaceae bacterium]|nr:aspartyl protease family protein [Stellaceae bacterium]